MLVERNAQIKAEVADLKHRLTALEERARNDLGMIAANETFYQVVDSSHRPPDSEPAQPRVDAGFKDALTPRWADASGSWSPPPGVRNATVAGYRNPIFASREKRSSSIACAP